MKRALVTSIVFLVCICSIASADTFGTGGNQFSIDFVTISGNTNPASGYGIVNDDYRMGTYEVTNDQFNKFQAAYGTVSGSPSAAYDASGAWTGTNGPVSNASWYEGAQFVNWLNTSKGHQAAYKFTGTQGTGGYTLGVWEDGDAGYDPSNPYRNSNAFYFLPTENEWVKAAYWNGTTLQTYATKAGESLHQGDGTSGTGWNYYDSGFAIDTLGPWDAGSGSQELNGTFDMMGNVWEWMESPYTSGDDLAGSNRAIRGGAYYFGFGNDDLGSSTRFTAGPDSDANFVGFRVASEIPEPATLALLALGGMAILRKRK